MMMSDADTVSNYTSTNLGAATNVRNQGGRGLHFSLELTKEGNTTQYQINAHKSDHGRGFKGWSGEQTFLDGADDWTATDNGPEPTS
jgi:hypothetical protein